MRARSADLGRARLFFGCPHSLTVTTRSSKKFFLPIRAAVFDLAECPPFMPSPEREPLRSSPEIRPFTTNFPNPKKISRRMPIIRAFSSRYALYIGNFRQNKPPPSACGAWGRMILSWIDSSTNGETVFSLFLFLPSLPAFGRSGFAYAFAFSLKNSL